MEEAAAEPVDIVLSAIVGAAGLRATAAAIRSGSDIALANKECLICAGSAFMALAREHKVRVLPVDSEHNALYQLIEGRDPADDPHLYADGFGRAVPHLAGRAHRARPRPQQAVAHPDLVDGRQDLRRFGDAHEQGAGADRGASPLRLAPESLDVLVHPQSVVHALVTFRDGSIHAELGAADMRRPIGYCLHWPERAREPVGDARPCRRRPADVRAGGHRPLSRRSALPFRRLSRAAARRPC